MTDEIAKSQDRIFNQFESLKHTNQNGIEYWNARELQNVLGYNQWRNFENIILKAKTACENSGNSILDHFAERSKMVSIGSGGERQIKDIILSRYACYLIVQNGDPNKEVIALGQTYFAIKTRQQELIDNYDQLTENNKRLAIRNEIKQHNKDLANAAKNAGVTRYDIFQNVGYQGLYGGLGVKEIRKLKNLSDKDQILDHMGSTELAANLFRATQTEEKITRERIRGEENANKTHYEVGKKIRQTIADIGGTMPEKLPKPEKSIRDIEKQQKKIEKGQSTTKKE